ncbi:MAG: ATP-binding protein [candidate division KSB1 bacterium]|nr:ATP-binding protein [candidate division KSB1 bacterium]MDZ7318410.1 ATP-binding protein [candidate division KSB1 bacterium]MDZ7342003.1 ATP-binding protein [candidate division KSB1 bacterium]
MRYQTPFEQIIVPAHINYLPELRKFIARLAIKYRFSKSETNALTISVDEACTNIIKHGYQDRPVGSITMNVQIKKDRVEVELIDYGISFDPNLVTDPNLSHYVQSGKKGGLGIFIMKKFLDEIHYVTAGQKNILRLIKFRQDGSVRPFLIPLTAAFRRLKARFFPIRSMK